MEDKNASEVLLALNDSGVIKLISSEEIGCNQLIFKDETGEKTFAISREAAKDLQESFKSIDSDDMGKAFSVISSKVSDENLLPSHIIASDVCSRLESKGIEAPHPLVTESKEQMKMPVFAGKFRDTVKGFEGREKSRQKALTQQKDMAPVAPSHKGGLGH